jgi:hypothetical protein
VRLGALLGTLIVLSFAVNALVILADGNFRQGGVPPLEITR